MSIRRLYDVGDVVETSYRRSNYVIPAERGLKLNVHKMFRRRPRRLMNVLYTFNLRPVSTGAVSIRRKRITLPEIYFIFKLLHFSNAAQQLVQRFTHHFETLL